MTASLEMKLVSTTGYECETTYEAVTPEQWGYLIRLLEGKSQPDCRTCAHHWDKGCAVYGEGCTNGDNYVESPKVVLWRTE